MYKKNISNPFFIDIWLQCKTRELVEERYYVRWWNWKILQPDFYYIWFFAIFCDPMIEEGLASLNLAEVVIFSAEPGGKILV